MWVFTSNAFLSIVADRTNGANLMVRARVKGDIERVFPGYKAKHTPTADYAFRASLPRALVVNAMSAVQEIAYDNFKNSVTETDRHDAYLSVWLKMLDFQRERLG